MSVRTRLRTRFARRRLFAATLVVFAIVALGSMAAAYFSYTDSSNAHTAESVAGSVGAANQPTFSVSGRDVSLSWAAATNATAYTVARTNLTPGSLSATVNGTCAGSVAGTTCTDTGLPLDGTNATTWTYTDTGTRFLWVGAPSPPSATITIPGPTLSLGSTSFTADGGSTSATVANFFDNEGVTYCVDQSVSCSAGNTLGTDTVPATGGTKTTPSITIPAGLSVGNHTVFAIGSNGSLPSVTINITAGAATKLVFTTQPVGNVPEGTNFTTSPVVSVEDANSNVVTTDTGNITLAVNTGPGTGTLSCSNPGFPTIAAVSGVATFTNCQITGTAAAGTYTLEATRAGLTDAISNIVVINVGAATTISVVSGSGQSATVNPAFTNPLVALVVDNFSNPVSGVSVTFTAPASGASATFAACTSNPPNSCVATTDASGQATSSTFTANSVAGTYNIAAGAPGTNTVTFSETNTSPGIVFVAAGATTTWATTSAQNVAMPAGVQQNDLLILVVSSTRDNGVTGDVTAPGWTKQQFVASNIVGNTDTQLHVFTKTTGAGEGPVSVTATATSSQPAAARVLLYHEAGGTPTWDIAAAANATDAATFGTVGTTTGTTTVTPTVSGSTAVSFALFRSPGTASLLTPNSFTTRWTSSGTQQSAGGADRVNVPASLLTGPQWQNTGANATWVYVLGVLKP